MNENQKKIEIMFVDDDPMLLASTRRQLLKKLPECKLTFFQRAIEALESIAIDPPDIVLSDVRMPEMDGADFLKQVSQSHPSTIRLAWTGQSDGELLDRVFETAHLVFGKPCPTETLHEMISTIANFAFQINAQEPVAPKELSNKRDALLKKLLATYNDIFIPNSSLNCK